MNSAMAAFPAMSQPKLENSLVEMCVLVGVDSDTALKVIRQDSQEDPLKDPFSLVDEVGPVETHVLAMITAQSAYYPHAKCSQVDPYYPHTSVRSNSRRVMRRISNKAQAIPQSINHEMVHSLPPLCFPDEAYVITHTKYSLQETIHTLVLTSISGERSYAACLSFHVPYIISLTKANRESGCFDLIQSGQSNDSFDESITCWIPKCICLISQAPYFGVMKKVLSSMLPDLHQSEHALLKSLKMMLYNLAMVPIPPPGNLSVEFSLNDMSMVVIPPDDSDKPVVDIALHIPFLSFCVEDALKIVSFILMQQPIVFLASNYALLTHVMECFLVFILPFKWPFTYVPIVARIILDLLEAPGCFLMGCHSEHTDIVLQIKGIVVADIDRGTIQVCKTVTVPKIPQHAVTIFKENFSSVRRFMVDLLMVGRPDSCSFESAQSFNKKMHRRFQLEIQNHFLEFMANLFRPMNDFISPELGFVKREEFVMSRPEEERAFYKMVIDKELFKVFVNDRLNKKQDYYTRLEKKMRPTSVASVSSLSDYTRYSGPSTRVLTARQTSSTMSECDLRHAISPLTHFSLPSFERSLDEDATTAEQFFDKSIKQLTATMMNVKSPGIKASYLYLRGMFRIANSKFVDGLDDLCNLNTVDLSIMPIDFMAKVTENLSTSDLEIVKKNPFYRSEEFLKKVEQKNSLNQKRLHYKEFNLDNLPDKLDLTEFIQRIQIMEIAIDVDVIEGLFKALTVGTDELQSDTFSFFIDCWKEGRTETASIFPHIKDRLRDGEYPLKVSHLIRSDNGSGRLILTQRRLVFMMDGNQSLHEVIPLKDIDYMERSYSYKSLIQVPALRIYRIGNEDSEDGNKPYTANLKAERNSWHMLITEMWNGACVSKSQKDPQVINQAAQNVVLLDAVIRSSHIENAMHARHVESAAMHLCHFTYRKKCQKTPNALKHRINPSIGESQRTTVEAMIYIPGNQSGGGRSDEDNSPKLWCALASGRVKVFDAVTWMLETEFCDAKDRVCCLLSIGDSVWAGSFDTNIYIIDVNTYTANQMLCDHSDYITDITVNADETIAYTSSLDGEIIVWDTTTLEKKQNPIQLKDCKSLISVKWINDKLWCCSKEAIRVLDPLTGDELKRAVYMDEKNYPAKLDCFLVVGDKLWVGCGSRGQLIIFNRDSLEIMDILRIDDCRGISKLVAIENRIWAGSKNGRLHLFNSNTHNKETALEAHDDAIRSMCTADCHYIITGSGSRDGKVAIWKANYSTIK